MGEDFYDFLKKHQAEAEWNKYYIPTKKLGEWALGELFELIKKNDIDFLHGNIVYEIAVTCLGKVEVERRLKQLDVAEAVRK